MQSPSSKLAKLPWHPAQAVVIVVGLFFVAQVIAAAIILLLAAGSGQGQGGSELITGSVWRQFFYVLLAETFTLGGLAWVLRRKKLGFRALGLTQPKLVDVLYVVGAFVIYLLLLGGLTVLVSWLVPSLDVNQKQSIGFDTAKSLVSLIPVFISLVILAPVTEEILMRGFLFGSLRPRMSFVWATLITSAVFGAAHLAGGEQGASLLWIAAIDTFVLSFVLCYLREKTGRLWASIGLHALKNGIAFVSLFVLRAT